MKYMLMLSLLFVGCASDPKVNSKEYFDQELAKAEQNQEYLIQMEHELCDENYNSYEYDIAQLEKEIIKLRKENKKLKAKHK